MNLDRLLKLLKLANHNPNDAEANSAARAASRMLGEQNYEWLERAKRNGGNPPVNKREEPTLKDWYDPARDEYNIKISKASMIDNPRIKELLRKLAAEVAGPRTWNDVKRSKEPFWRSKKEPFDESWGENTGFNWEKEFWEKYEKTVNEEAKRQRHRDNYSYDRETKSGGFYGGEWDIPYDKPPKKERPKREPVNWTWTQQEEGGNVRYRKVYEQRMRRCSKCDYDQLTSDDTTPFVCYKCKNKQTSDQP